MDNITPIIHNLRGQMEINKTDYNFLPDGYMGLLSYKDMVLVEAKTDSENMEYYILLYDWEEHRFIHSKKMKNENVNQAKSDFILFVIQNDLDPDNTFVWDDGIIEQTDEADIEGAEGLIIIKRSDPKKLKKKQYTDNFII